MSGPRLKMRPISDFGLAGKTVIFRPDINSPIDPATKRIVNTNRLEKTVPTLNALLDGGAKVAIIAHQGGHSGLPEPHTARGARGDPVLSHRKAGPVHRRCVRERRPARR